MKRAGKDLTRAKLITSLESLGHFEPGVLPPIDWSTAYHGGPKTFGYAQWKGGKLAVLQGW
jgi:branched-chain amino acid transport system substrate-binding protein